jgi:serine/threonine-protein kinase
MAGKRRDDRDEDLFAGTSYRYVRMVGMGGSACLYEVEHTRFGRRFVAKVLRESLAADPQARERMEIEADTAVLVRHPHLVDTIDFDWTDDGRPFLVMELLQGTDLRAELERVQQFPLQDAIRILHEIAEALAAAHAAGIIHRDLKPDNVFLHFLSSGPPTIKLLDWGLAKIVASGRADTAKKRLCPTDKDMFVGTPEYVAPEQVLGHTVDHRADVYSMGVLLFELITGRRPFAHAKDPTAACLERDPFPPSKWARGVPRVLDRVVMKALHRDPKQRFQTVLEFDRALLSAGKYTSSRRIDLQLTVVSTLVTCFVTFSLLEVIWGRR